MFGKRMHDCLIAFGSNEGNSVEIFAQATKRISEIKQVQSLVASKPLETQPVGGPEGQNSYLNAAIRLQTDLGAAELHRELVKIETELGRERRSRWGSRKIDLDLLLFGLLQLDSESLTLPHPRMSFRRFVLEPAREIAGDLVHASSGLTIDQLLGALNERENLVLFVTQQGEFIEHEKLILDLLPTRWQLKVVSEEVSLNQTSGQAKLVCFVNNFDQQELELNPLIRLAASQPSPTLRLDQDLEKSKVEIKAAFQAIKKFH